MTEQDRDPAADLREIAFRLEAANEATYRVRAFRSAAAAIAKFDRAELLDRATEGTLAKLKGVGDVTARCIAESLAGQEPVYLRRLAATEGTEVDEATDALRRALRGDCHSHTEWSDGGSPIEEMALAAVGLGHEYLVVTDHSPRLTIANGLSADRLRKQIDAIEAINAELPPGFRVLTGIEVDILADGTLDQDPELLERLDLVVGSVHSGLRDERDAMTRRMLAAIANPNLDILGHCTGRKVLVSSIDGAPGNDERSEQASDRAQGSDRAHRRGRSRPESSFDADAVFAACVEYDKAVEINCRPDRLDPPKRLLRLAVEAGCRFSIDTDAHAPGQLDWLRNGCERAARCAVPVESVVNTWSTEHLLEWTAGHAG